MNNASEEPKYDLSHIKKSVFNKPKKEIQKEYRNNIDKERLYLATPKLSLRNSKPPYYTPAGKSKFVWADDIAQKRYVVDSALKDRDAEFYENLRRKNTQRLKRLEAMDRNNGLGRVDEYIKNDQMSMGNVDEIINY